MLADALAGLPEEFYDDAGNLIGDKVLVRTDSAGASRKFLGHLDGLGVQFSVSYPVPVAKSHMIGWINDKTNCPVRIDEPTTES